MLQTRRQFFRLLATPAIVRAASLMPVVAMAKPEFVTFDYRRIDTYGIFGHNDGEPREHPQAIYEKWFASLNEHELANGRTAFPDY